MIKKILKYVIILILIIVGFFTFKSINRLIYKSIYERPIDSLSIKKRDSLVCECSKVRARKDIILGNIKAYFNDWSKPYLDEIAFNGYGILIEPLFPNEKRICDIGVMDSFIYARFGNDFFEKLEKKADSINALKPWKGISLDGVSVGELKYPKYRCGGDSTIYKLIEDSLTKRGLLPMELNECIPGDLVIDIVITQEGKLNTIMCLEKVNPAIDSCVINLLKKLPCDFQPAESTEGKKVSVRKKMYFFFGKPLPPVRKRLPPNLFYDRIIRGKETSKILFLYRPGISNYISLFLFIVYIVFLIFGIKYVLKK